MARFSIPGFISGVAQVGAAQLSGAAQGELELQQEQNNQFSQALQVAQLVSNRQQQQYQDIGRLPLDYQSQATLAGGLGAQPDPYAGLENLPAAKRNPGLLAALRATHAAVPVQTGAAPGMPAASSPGAAGAPSSAPAGQANVPNAPANAPPTGQTGQNPLSFNSPYGKLSLNGFDPKQAAALQAAIKKSAGNLLNASPDPQTQQTIATLMQQAPGEIKTPEDMQRAQEIYSRLSTAEMSMGPQASRLREGQIRDDEKNFETEGVKNISNLSPDALRGALPGMLQEERSIRERRGDRGYGGLGLESSAADIEEMQKRADAGDTDGANQLAQAIGGRITAKKDARSEARILGLTLKQISTLPLKSATPKNVRAIYKANGIGYLVDNLPDDALLMGGAVAQRQMQESLRNLPNFKNLNASAQKVALDNITYLSRYSDQPVTVPAEIISQMTPAQKQQLALAGQRVKIASEQADTAAGNAATAKARLGLDQAKFAWLKQNGPNSPGGKGAKLTPNAQATMLHNEAMDAYKQYTLGMHGIGLDPATFDPTRQFDPNPAKHYPPGSAQERLANLWQAWQQKSQDYQQFFPGPPSQSQPKGGGATPNAQRPTQPTGNPQGAQPGAVDRQRRGSVIQGLRERGYREDQINAALRRRGML